MIGQFVPRAVSYRRLSTIAEHFFTKKILCSEENKARCLESMQNMNELNLAKKPPRKTAAVLIPLVEHPDEGMSLLYTLRSSNLKRHVRQVSFPGGMRDTDDRSYVDCALRETREEIGILSDAIKIWGNGRMVIPKHGPSIMPVIGMIEKYNKAMLKINSDEVEKVFTAPIDKLCSNSGTRHTQYRGMYSAPVYLGFEERIWGITGFLTHLFLLALVPRELYKRRLKYVTNYRL